MKLITPEEARRQHRKLPYDGHPLETWVTVTVRDAKTGRIEQRLKFASRSYVKGFLNLMHSLFANAASLAQLDTLSVSRTLNPTAGNFSFILGAANQSLSGIVVGTGSTALAVTQTQLATQIAHGIGAGQLTHNAHSYGNTGTSGSIATMTAARTFSNNSGGDITLAECGLYVEFNDTGVGLNYFMVIRDLISPTVLVSSTKVAMVEYTFQTTV